MLVLAQKGGFGYCVTHRGLYMDKSAERVSAGWFLYDLVTEMVLIHQRNDKKSGNPKEWDYFGGGGKKGETPEEALRRELCEELCIYPRQDRVKPLDDWVEGEWHKYIFYVLPTREEKKNMRLREGAGMGWFSFDEALKLVDLASDEGKKLRLLRLLRLLRKKVGASRSKRATRAFRKRDAS